MNRLIFATNNLHKIFEINYLLKNKLQILGLKDIGCEEELPETQETIEGNALQKALFVYEKYRVDCFADDTGLEVDALNGNPGVYSARYAGEGKNFEDNINKVLSELNGIKNREARFRCVIAMIKNDEQFMFEGIVEGIILCEKRGIHGFGYDSVFQPNGYNITFAEMTIEEKNMISHRSLAIKKLVQFINR